MNTKKEMETHIEKDGRHNKRGEKRGEKREGEGGKMKNTSASLAFLTCLRNLEQVVSQI